MQDNKLDRTVSEEDSSDEMYDVEKIVDKRIQGGKIDYLIKWKGYCSDENEWKPIEELEFITEMIDDYEK